MVFKMNRCEYKSIVEYIINHLLCVKQDNSIESAYYQKQNALYVFQVSFKQNSIVFTLFEFDNNKKISSIFNYTLFLHSTVNSDNNTYYPYYQCNNAWKWILPFVKKMEYMIYGV